MVHNLLNVCLLTITMGVGAKASTPINLNRQENTKQCRQLQQENTSEQQSVWLESLAYIMEHTTTPALDWQDIGGEDDYITNYFRSEYGVQNTNINTDAKRFGDVYYWSDNLNDYYYEPEWLEGNQSYQDVYIWRINGANIGFRNWKVNFDIRTDIAVHNNPTDVEIFYNVELKVVNTTADISEFYNRNFNWTNNQLYDYLTNEKRNYTTVQTLTNQDNQTNANLGVREVNLQFVPNTYNYLLFFYHLNIFTSDSDLYNEYKYEINIGNTATDFTYPMTYYRMASGVHPYYPTITGEVIQITGITQEVVDIPGLMWQILGMPFTFISTAFNLTLFPGTQYAINVSNLMLTIFGVLVFVFILGIIRKRV